MRPPHARTLFRFAAFLTAVTVLACAGGEKAETPDSAASAAAAAPPPPESFTLVASDGSWSGDISPAGIVYRPRRGDSLVFAFKAPNVNGAISEYDVLMTAKDTIRISLTLAMTPCTASGSQHSHQAQLWLTGKQGGRELNTQTSGCASKK
jgi:uncharacterized membrane protein